MLSNLEQNHSDISPVLTNLEGTKNKNLKNIRKSRKKIELQ